MEVLAVIPARSGSKGIPGKNLRKIQGKTLVEWSILHAKSSSRITRIIVSTDSPEIAQIAIDAGAEAPFLRPAELSGDKILDLPVFEHVLNFLEENENYIPDIVIHLRPTAPYRESNWIDESIDLFQNSPLAESVRSVSHPVQHPYRVFELDQDGYLEPIMKHKHEQPHNLRRQDLPNLYFYNCVLDVTKPSTIKSGSMTGNKILPYLIPSESVIDIDSPRDLYLAEILMREIL